MSNHAPKLYKRNSYFASCDTAKYDDARADDNNLGGNDDADDSLSDFSDNNSDGQSGA